MLVPPPHPPSSAEICHGYRDNTEYRSVPANAAPCYRMHREAFANAPMSFETNPRRWDAWGCATYAAVSRQHASDSRQLSVRRYLLY